MNHKQITRKIVNHIGDESTCIECRGDIENFILNSLEEYRDEIINECENALFMAVELREFLDADKQNEKEWIDSVLKQL